MEVRCPITISWPGSCSYVETTSEVKEVPMIACGHCGGLLPSRAIWDKEREIKAKVTGGICQDCSMSGNLELEFDYPDTG